MIMTLLAGWDWRARRQEALVRSHGRGWGAKTGHGMVWRVEVRWWPHNHYCVNLIVHFTTVVLSRQLWVKVNNYLMTSFQRLSFVHYDAASKQFSNLLCTLVHA